MRFQRTSGPLRLYTLILQAVFIPTFLIGTIGLSPATDAQAREQEPAPVQQPGVRAPLFAPLASVTLAVPDSVQIGQSFSFTVTFDNTDADEVGYGPFIDIVFPVLGVDGTAVGPPNDGIDFTSATFLGASVVSVENTFGAAGTGGCGALGSVDHPYAISAGTGLPHVVCGTPGDKLVTLLLPFGSFAPDQPAAVVTVDAIVSDLADLNSSLNLYARGGYQYGATPTNDWCCGDATIVSHSGPGNTWLSSSVSPTLLSITKEYLGSEDETATGPNYLQEYTLSVDIADGQQIANLTIVDNLPVTMQYVGLVSSSPAATCSAPSTSTPGGTLSCDFGTVTGGPGANDATLTFEFYVPLDDSLSNPVIDADTGDAVFNEPRSQNQASVSGDWTPIDPRDPTTTTTSGGVCPTGCHTLAERSIAIQKGVANIVDTGALGNSPGDTLEYTLQIQISDFFTFEGVDITDILSDGQRVNTAVAPTMQINGNGFTLSASGMDAGNYDLDCYYTGAAAPTVDCDTASAPVAPLDVPSADDSQYGTTWLTFHVSDELILRATTLPATTANEIAARNHALQGRLLGGCVELGGGRTSPCDALNLGDGPTTVTITFQTIIQDDFSDAYQPAGRTNPPFYSGDSSVDHGDVLTDDVTITGDLLSVADNSTPTGFSEPDTSAASAALTFGALTKTVYAVNGTVCEPCTAEISTQGVSPGETLTFRLTYSQPSSDFEQTVLTDYLPLPVFEAATVTTFSNTVCGVPVTGNACLGPDDTYHDLNNSPVNEPNPVVTPVMTTDAVNNTVSFTYATYDSITNTSSEIDVLFTLTLEDEPFADGLFLTNQAGSAEGTTNAGSQALNTILQILINEPLLIPTKSAVSTNSTAPGITFSPAIGAPIVFDVPGIVDGTPDWSGGVISSNYLASNPIDADLTGIDGGDLIKFAIVIENTGHGSGGAFDVAIKDAMPAELLIPGSGLNLEVFLGDGTSISYVDANPGNPGLFGDGIELVDPGVPATGACQAHDDTNGQNIIIITYDLQLSGTGMMNPDIINTTTLLSYASTDGGTNFVPSGVTDTAEITPATPTLVKSIRSTSEAHTSDAASPVRVAIGEIVRYRLLVTLPEGVFTNFQMDDNLQSGMVYLDDGTARVGLISNGTTQISSAAVGTLPVPAIPSPACVITGNELTAIPDPLPCALDDFNVGINNSIAADTDAQASYTSGLDPQFKLGTLTNVDDDSDSEFVVVEFNALIDNSATGSNDAGDTRNNSFSVSVNGTAYGAISANVAVRILEPSITNLDKGVNPTSGDAGDTVTYTVTFSNANGGSNTTAFDVNLLDTAPVKMSLNLGSLSVSFSPAACSSLTTNNSAGNNIDLVFGTVPVGCQVSASYDALLLATVNPGEALINTADVTYTSLPDGNGTTSNPTGSSTPGSSGADNGERDGSGAPAHNDYSDSDGAQVDVTAIQPGKTLISSSDPLTLGSDLTIGEIGRYRMAILLAEGTSPDFQIVDNIPPGLEYLDDGSTRVAFVSDDGDATCATSNPTISSGAFLIGDNPWICGNDVTLATVTPTFVLPSGFITGGPFSTGVDPTFELDDITNTDTDANAEYILVEFNARVLNVAGNQDVPATTLDNTYTVFINAINQGTSGPASISLVEPVLALDKQLSSITGEVDAGGLANYSVTLTNNGTAPAYDSNFVDTLPAVLDLDHLSVNVSFAGGASGVTDNSSNATNQVNVVIGTIPVGGSATITYSATILVSVTPEQLIQNTGDLTWTSISGTDANERNGSGGVNDYSGTDTASFTTDEVTFAKQLTATSSSHTSGSDVVIGEIITYDILLTFPEGTTDLDTVVDALPAGLELVSGSAQVIDDLTDAGSVLAADFNGTFAVATSTITEAPGSVTFVFDDVVVDGDNITNNNTLQLRFQARVTNVLANQDGTVLSNQATNQVGAATPTDSNAVDADVVEPVLTVAKTVTDPTPAVGQVLTFTLTLTHTSGTPDAFDIVWTDDIPVELDLNEASVSLATSGPPSSVVNAAVTPADPLIITADSMRSGGVITVTFEATVIGAYGAQFDNETNATWSSLFGSITGERDGSNGPSGLNDYISSDLVTINPDRALVKNLTATNVDTTGTIGVPAGPTEETTIGEIVTYQLVLTIPAGNTDTAIITDTLDDGLAFVDVASFVISDEDTDGGGGDTGISFTGSAAPVVTSNGHIVTFDLGDISNTDTNAQTITVTYDVVVLDIAANVQNQGVLLDNDVEWSWSTGDLSTQSPIALEIVEPDMEIEKTVDPLAAALNSVVTFTININHTSVSETTAYDVILTDNLPTGLELVPGSIVTTETGGVTAGDTSLSTATSVIVSWAEFPLLGTATVTFDAVFVGPSPTVNTASVEWSTLEIDPVLVAGVLTPIEQSVYNADSTERWYDPLASAGPDTFYTVESSVVVAVPARLPRTGFAPGQVTKLPEQPGDLAYTALSDLWLEIPKLGVRVDIVGVPFAQKDWDLTWLGENAGYLEGTAYPTHDGNSAITAHAYLADGTAGPFADLDDLSYGDQIIVHLGRQQYVYEVREEKQVRPDSVASVLKHEEYAWLTLITCKTYSEATDDYVYRLVTRAVLVDVISE